MLMYEERRLATLSRIAEQQLVLRDLMGVPPNDGQYMELVAMPSPNKPVESVQESIQIAINRRPDVLRQRLAVYVAQQNRLLARDQLKPIVNLNAFWRINGLGDDLGSSLGQVGDSDYNDWNLGFSVKVPLGRRKARAELRESEYLIQRERTLLDQVAHQTAFEVADAYRRIEWLHRQHEVTQARIAALQDWQTGAKAQMDTPPPGMSKEFALELYLSNLRDAVDAVTNSNAILADYSSAMARLEEVKGTLLDSTFLEISGDSTNQLPTDLPSPELPVMQP
jgi:outer membrane protein TolC